jgi:outer membrane immunogenic protein
MQKTVLAATLVATLGMGASAQAADLNRGSLKDAPVYMPASTWTGFYFGAGGGGAAVNHDLKAGVDFGEFAAGVDLNGIGGTGGFGTVQVGYDRQLDQHFVVGVFFDYDFHSLDSKLTLSAGGESFSIKSSLTDSWTVGGRAGYLVNANTLVYGLAGYTEAHFDMPLHLNGDFTGWTAGAGIETNLGGPLFLKGEYRFTQLDEKTLFSAGSFFKFSDQPDIQTGRLVLTYKLNATDYSPLK